MLVEPVEQLGFKLLLGHTRTDDLAQLSKRLVGDGLRLAHQLHFPRLLRGAERINLGLHRHEHRVELVVVAQVVAIGHVGFLDAKALDRMRLDDVVDAVGIAVIGVDKLHREPLEVGLGGFDVAAVGKIVALAARHKRNALGHTVLCGIEPVVDAGEQQAVGLSGLQQALVLFKIFHGRSSFFRLQ